MGICLHCKSQPVFNSLPADDEKIYELIQGRVLFRGKPGPNDAWTAEEDQLAQMVELFGPLPASLRTRGKLSCKYFDEDGESSVAKFIFNYYYTHLTFR